MNRHTPKLKPFLPKIQFPLYTKIINIDCDKLINKIDWKLWEKHFYIICDSDSRHRYASVSSKKTLAQMNNITGSSKHWCVQRFSSNTNCSCCYDQKKERTGPKHLCGTKISHLRNHHSN